MRCARVLHLVLSTAAATFVISAVDGITVEHKAAFPDIADRAHHGTGKVTKSRPAVSPGIVSAVLKVKLAPSTSPKHTDCNKGDNRNCAKHSEWDSKESQESSVEYNSEESYEEDVSVEVQDKERKSVKVVSGLDDSIEDDEKGRKKNEQNEIPDIPIYSGSFVGVDSEENYNDGFTPEGWNLRKGFIGDNHRSDYVPYYGNTGQFHLEYLMEPGPLYQKNDGIYHSNVHVAKVPKPYHSLMMAYEKSSAYPLLEQPPSLLISSLNTKKIEKELIHIDDKINFPKKNDKLEHVSITFPSTEIVITGKIDAI